jgi:hypothetical protein
MTRMSPTVAATPKRFTYGTFISGSNRSAVGRTYDIDGTLHDVTKRNGHTASFDCDKNGR